MISVSQSAQLLQISDSRVRALIAQGVLPAEKVGRAWMLDERSVIERVENHPKAGRPRTTTEVKQGKSADLSKHINNSQKNAYSEQNNQMHDLYLACKKAFRFRPNVQLLEDASGSEESDFYIAVADFFLQHRQKELIEDGVF